MARLVHLNGPSRVGKSTLAHRYADHHGTPIRALARKYDVHRRTVRQAIASPLPPERKVPDRAAPGAGRVAGWIDDMLRGNLAAPRKRQHTARRVFERLRDEHDAAVSYSYVAKYVHERRAEIAAEDRGRR